MEADNSAPKQRGGFRKGVSGNPKGKPPGTRNRATVTLDKIGEGAAADVLRAVISAALEGDASAANAVLARVWPVRKGGRPVVFDLPRVARAEDLPAALAAVSSAVASGKLTTDEAAAVAGILDVQRKASETCELAARIAALEAGRQT